MKKQKTVKHEDPKRSIEINALVLCEDVRREDNGKQFLVGVYNRDIIFGRFPATLNLCLWVRFTPSQTGIVQLAFRVMGGDDLEFGQCNASYSATDTESIAVGIRMPQISLQAPIILDFQMREGATDQWKSVLTIPVKTNAMPPLPANIDQMIARLA